MRNPVILLVAAVLVLGCGSKKKGAPGRKQGGQKASARPSPNVVAIQNRLVLSAPEKERYAAVEALVKGWPRTQKALPAALGLVRADGANCGGYAMSLARLGRPLVPALNQMVARSPRHLPTLRAGGAISYHLVMRGGLIQRSDAERAALRKGLRPSFRHFWAMFLTDTRPEYEIYQGVAVGAEEAIRRFLLPIPEGGLTRVAMVLHLILSNKPKEALLPAADRARLRDQAAGLAKPLAEALTRTRPDGSGENLESLILGLSVLGRHAASAVAAVEGLSKQPGCPVVVKCALGLVDHFPDSEVAPLGPALRRCAGFKWDSNPQVGASLKTVLARLAAKP